MIEASIYGGDGIVVRHQPIAENGDVVAAMLVGKATAKRFKREDDHVSGSPASISPVPG